MGIHRFQVVVANKYEMGTSERAMTTGFTRPRPETGFFVEIEGFRQIFWLKNPVSSYPWAENKTITALSADILQKYLGRCSKPIPQFFYSGMGFEQRPKI
ncbi:MULTISPECIES: hypothetical protein [unclassified Microcoleus]|uniref:hypothetical protein n=1 Tax=unclassified Microcoleus TaxID=2642155 RepID=UPI002FD35604